MQLLEIVEVFEDRLDDIVDHLFRNLGRGYKSRADTKGLGVLIGTAVHTARNGCRTIVGILLDQLVNRRTVHVDQDRITGSGRFLDRAVRMTDDIDHGVNLVVAQCLRLLGRFQLRGEFQVGHLDAGCLHQDFHGAALSGTGVADIDALALDIHEVLDAGIGPGDHGERLRVNGEDRPQVLVRPLVGKLAGAVIGVILPVRLGNAHIELAGSDGVQVVNRTTGTFNRATDAVLLAGLVDQATDGATGRIINTGHAAGTDGDKLVMAGSFTLLRNKCNCDRNNNQQSQQLFHVMPP